MKKPFLIRCHENAENMTIEECLKIECSECVKEGNDPNNID